MNQTPAPQNITSSSVFGSVRPDHDVNFTSSRDIPMDTAQRIFITSVNAVIALVITVVNVPVLVVWMAGNRRKHTPSSAVVVNLMIFDLCVAGALYLRIGVLLSDDMAKNPFVCVFHFSCLIMGCIGMQMSLLLAVVDRYISVVHSLRYHQIVTYNVVLVCVLATYVSMFVVSFSPLIPGFHNWDKSTTCTFNQSLKTGYLYLICGFILVFSCISLTLYARVLYIARKHQKRIMAAVRVPGYSVTGDGDRGLSQKQLNSNSSTVPNQSSRNHNPIDNFRASQDNVATDSARMLASAWTTSDSSAMGNHDTGNKNSTSFSEMFRDSNFRSPDINNRNSSIRTEPGFSGDCPSQILDQSKLQTLNSRKDLNISRYKPRGFDSTSTNQGSVNYSPQTFSKDIKTGQFIVLSKHLYTNDSVYLGNSASSNFNLGALCEQSKCVDEDIFDKVKDNVDHKGLSSDSSALTLACYSTGDLDSNGGFCQDDKYNDISANSGNSHSIRPTDSDTLLSILSPSTSTPENCQNATEDKHFPLGKNAFVKRENSPGFPLNTPTTCQDSKDNFYMQFFSSSIQHGTSNMVDKKEKCNPPIIFLTGNGDKNQTRESGTSHCHINKAFSTDQEDTLPTVNETMNRPSPTSVPNVCHNEQRIPNGAQHQVRDTRSNTVTAQDKQLNTHTESARSKKRRLRQSGIANVVFCCCWFPYMVVQLLMINNYEMSLVPNNVASFLIMIDAILNPFIYVWGNARMRRLMVNWWRQQRGLSRIVSQRESQLTTFSETI